MTRRLARAPHWKLGAAVAVLSALSGSVLAAGVPAQQAKADRVRVTAYADGIFRLTTGPASSRLDLSDRLSGCTTGTYDGSDPQSRPSGGAAQTRVLDLVQKGGFWYLTFQASLESNCNVQGECGAATDTTLVWLKLTPALRVAARQTEVIEDCRAGRNIVSTAGSDETDDVPRLDLRGGVLRVVSLKSDYVANSGVQTTLRYLHAAPQRGLTVSSKKVALN